MQTFSSTILAICDPYRKVQKEHCRLSEAVVSLPSAAMNHPSSLCSMLLSKQEMRGSFWTDQVSA
jgi:hypothetical protein